MKDIVLFVPLTLLVLFIVVLYGTMKLIHKVFDPVFYWLFGPADTYRDFGP